MANEYRAKEYTGGAPQTALAGDITVGATAFDVADGTGYPTGAVNPFVIAVDYGEATEEKMLVTRSVDAITVVERGYDNSTAQVHSAGATVRHVLDAYSIEQANALANTTTTRGDLIVRGVTNDDRLAVGDAGDVLTSDGTDPAWQPNYPVQALVIQDFMGVTVPDGYIGLEGQTVTDFETLYPVAWANLPAAMKSGSDAVMPDTRERMSMGLSATGDIGDTGGSADAIVVSHSHSNGTLATDTEAAHSHADTFSTAAAGTHDHDDGSLITALNGGHSHTAGVGDSYLKRLDNTSGASGSMAFSASTSEHEMVVSWSSLTDAVNSHSHTVSGTVASDGSHAHTVTGSVSDGGAHSHDVTGSTSSAGSSGTDANLPPYIMFRKILKVH